MNSENSKTMEALLRQVQLVEPPQSLDEAVLSESRMATEPRRSKEFGWMAMASTAVAASLVGLFVGIANSSERIEKPGVTEFALNNVSDKMAFQTYHGHSSHSDFQQCSDCHVFPSKQEQVIEKWIPEENCHVAGELGLPNCSMCHVSSSDEADDQGPLPASDLPPEIQDLDRAEQMHRHLEFGGLDNNCASCHRVELPLEGELVPRS